MNAVGVLDKKNPMVYNTFDDLTVNERALIQAVRSIVSGHVTACKDKGNITHIKIEQTKKL